MERRLSTSSGLDPSTASDYDRADMWIAELERLDRVLEKPARSLIDVAHLALGDGIAWKGKTIHSMPTTFGAADWTVTESHLIHAVACSAIQRLDNQRRRFPWLKDHDKQLRELRSRIPEFFREHPKLKSTVPLETVEALPDPAFGMLGPLVASEVFWVLVRAGESYAHGDLGFLALFGLIWALKRRIHGPFELGAAVGQWRPTVAITTRCLLPILTLLQIVENRARLWREAARVCDTIDENAAGTNQSQKWRFASEIDHLSGILHDLAGISINPKDFHRAADTLTKIASPLRPASPTTKKAPRVRRVIRHLLEALREQNEDILAKAEHATNVVQQEVLDVLADDKSPARRIELGRKMNLIPEWEQQHGAAKDAKAVCVAALNELKHAVTICKALPTGKAFTHNVMVEALKDLAAINVSVHRILKDAINPNIEWCIRNIDREVAFASAKNDTEFDAAELLSGVLIGERKKSISSIEANHAIALSLRAAREDGSWWSGQPVFLEKRVVGVWPSTPDVVLLLATAVRQFDDIDCADAHLRRFIDWLEIRAVPQKPKWWDGDEPLWGWSSEAREPEIDVWTTATAVKALLEIREIIEDRLWSICRERFTVLTKLKRLTEIDPVDLGAKHEVRLQTRLLRNAASARLNEDKAEYSYVLHGPPGSSKSVLGQAIGSEMWSEERSSPRFVRITPADFTRRGESGLDFEARFIFRLLSHVRGVTIFFDEIDDLLRVREIGAEASFIRLVIPGMLNRLQDLRDSARAQQICFLLGTNYIDQIEPALIRPGRIDLAIPVPYPDAWSRQAILEDKTKGVVSNALTEHIVKATAEWPWTTYRKLCGKVDAKTTIKGADKLIDELKLEFQKPDAYYLNPKRWLAASPLDSELVHVAFSIAKEKDECLRRVQSVVDQFKQHKKVRISDLPRKFETEWNREGRT